MEHAYFLDQCGRTRTSGILMGIVLVPVVVAFMVIDAATPILYGIEAWRIGMLASGVAFLAYALFVYPQRREWAIGVHVIQLAGLMICMCGIAAQLATRPGFPDFGRTALISSLLVCIFADFAFASGARRWLPAVLIPPLVVMGVYVELVESALTQTEKLWLISNPMAMAIILSVLALAQERSGVKEFRARSELAHAEEALRESEKRRKTELEEALQRLEFVLAASRTGLDIIDQDYVVRYVDPARRALMGDPAGRRCYEYFRGLDRACDSCAMENALRTRTVQVMEQSNPRLDGRPAQVTAIPYSGEGGKWMVAEVIVDISERAQAEAARLDLERRIASSEKLESLGILAGGIAHHFNNLLTVILGHAELLKDVAPSGSGAASSVREIVKAGNRSRDLVLQLLAMGRQQVLELRGLDLNAVLRENAPTLRAAIREEIAVDYFLSPQPCPIEAARERISEILLHLALNAQDAISGEGRISIDTSEVILGSAGDQRGPDLAPGPYVRLTVSDTGTGMDRETTARVFDPFFTTKESGTATGLGLSTVYGIVKQHKGTIEVESAPGTGTRFTIYFPRFVT